MRLGRVQRRPREAGVALLLAVWVLALLAVIGGELIASGRVRYFTELNRRDELRGLALALAGYHDALAALEKVIGLQWDEDKKQLLLKFPDNTEGIPATRENVPLGDGTFSWRIEDEDGRVNINTIPRSQLVDLLQECGMEFGVDRDTVADSILDWVDETDSKKLNGAEEQEYQALTPPYSCKDGEFDVVEELLLVRGVTREIFEGGEVDGKKRPGMRDLVTTFVPQGTKVNLATAPEEVLKAMKLARTATLTQSNNFSIIATGYPGGSDQSRSLRAVVRRDTGSKPPFILLYWNDNYSPG